MLYNSAISGPCLAGSYRSDIMTFCEPCMGDTYSSDEGASYCTPCEGTVNAQKTMCLESTDPFPQPRGKRSFLSLKIK